MFEVIPHPGAVWGPCPGDCQHRACAESRVTAALHCAACGEPIGYDQRFTIESLDWSRVLHSSCALVQFDQPRAGA